VGRRFSRFFVEKSGTAWGAAQEMIKIISCFLTAMFYIYIIYSESADRYYVGHTNDPERRLFEHNNIQKTTFSSKYRPWTLVFKFPVSENRSEAIIVEKYIKGRKSTILLRKLISSRTDTRYLKQFFERIILKKIKRTG
jgi:putative endonuclease